MINSKTPNKSVLIKFNDGKHVYDRIHMDFLGPFRGKTYLIIPDSFSKLPEVYEMSKIDSKNTIDELRDCLSRYGLPNTIVPDNGSSLVSAEFKNFCTVDGINHITSPPYHPATNGAAENSVKSFRIAMNTLLTNNSYPRGMSTLVSKYLFSYRNTPHTVTGETPSKLMFSRKIKTRLDFLTRSASDKAEEWQIRYHHGERMTSFEEGEIAYVRDYRNPQKPSWTKAVIVSKLG
ncbi:hypothetical protein JTB14_002515 [Gonioctena quinquepunctata]|nr:hypothetical protein JTB14_002515 [Gonioctena quinquepunctata]